MDELGGWLEAVLFEDGLDEVIAGLEGGQADATVGAADAVLTVPDAAGRSYQHASQWLACRRVRHQHLDLGQLLRRKIALEVTCQRICFVRARSSFLCVTLWTSIFWKFSPTQTFSSICKIGFSSR